MIEEDLEEMKNRLHDIEVKLDMLIKLNKRPEQKRTSKEITDRADKALPIDGKKRRVYKGNKGGFPKKDLMEEAIESFIRESEKSSKKEE